jgi:hypothetical protein
MKKGSHHTAETLQKMRDKANRNPRPSDVIEQISLSKKAHSHPYRGKTLSEEHKQHISEGMRKKRQSQIEDDYIEI